jgi:hypothetical protein
VKTIAWVLWIGILVAVSILCRWLWKLADKIERQEQYEAQWLPFLETMQRSDPWSVPYWRQQYEQNYPK